MWSKIDPVLRFSPTRFWRTAAAPSFPNLSAEIVRRDAALKTPCILEAVVIRGWAGATSVTTRVMKSSPR